MPECFFEHLGGCEGRLVKAHLVPKSKLRRIAIWDLGLEHEDEVAAVMWDPRAWVPMCGGATGIGGHHGAYDAKQIRLDEWPQDFLEYLDEYGISWIAEAYAR